MLGGSIRPLKVPLPRQEKDTRGASIAYIGAP
jgi:hypothetical protein